MTARQRNADHAHLVPGVPITDARIQVLRAKANARARRRSDASLAAAAEKADRVATYARSEDARAVFNALADVYRTEIERRRSGQTP